MKKLNIYGDNILECEEALRLLTSALEMELLPVDSPLYTPTFHLTRNDIPQYEIKLYPGYDRWEYDIKKVMESMGAKLREATDAVITEIDDDNSTEVPILAMEFCGALPAGNNAWQRTGRAISCAQSGIPYLYFAELGGVELGENRKIKAARFPNPIIPFAYLSLGKTYDSVTLPIYQPSPSITLELHRTFAPYFAGEELNSYIKSVITGKEDLESKKIIEKKAIELTAFLSSKRRNQDNILSPAEWKELSIYDEGDEIATYLIKKGISWKKRVTIPTTKTFQTLLEKVSSMGANAVGSSEMPFCLLSSEQRKKLVAIMDQLYGKRLEKDFKQWLETSKPLFIAWVAGFKPRGDDSRPDRGLVPLLRMVVGEEGVDVLTIIYGPSKKVMLRQLETDMWGLAKSNGLWQSVLHYSDGVIIDTTTTDGLSIQGYKITDFESPTPTRELLKPSTSIVPIKFGEHDVDTVLHEVFYLHKDEAFFEGLCNPPGGNWSGISLFNFNDGLEIRWVSLPRVSGVEAKRPDHLFQINISEDVSNILTIESKETPASVEKDIGVRLTRYITELIKVAPNVYRSKDEVTWRTYDIEYLEPKTNIFSAVAFKLDRLDDIYSVSDKSKADAIIGVEFLEDGHIRLKLLLNDHVTWLGDFLNNRIKYFGGWLEIKIH